MCSVLRYSLESLACGVYPSERHDELPATFGPGDDSRFWAMGGTSLGFKGALLGLKSDWDAVSQFVGLPTATSLVHPCPLCCSDRDHLHNIEGLSALHTPVAWPIKSDVVYEGGVRACEIALLLGWQDVRRILACLWYDRRKGSESARGRALNCDIPHLGLKKHDRLEPSALMPSVHELEFVRIFPTIVTFWRRSGETVARHRNPIIAEHLGTSISRLIQMDTMHTMALGVVSDFCAATMYRLFAVDFWATGTRTNSPAAGGRVQAELWRWYGERERAGFTVHKAQNLNFRDFGTAKHPKLALNAAQTNTYLEFLNFTLAAGRADVVVGISLLRETGFHLQRLRDLPKTIEDPLLPLPLNIIQVESYGGVESSAGPT